MNRIAKFEKVSKKQFKKDWLDTFPNEFSGLDEKVIDNIIDEIYDSIKLPKRATSGSAGYDFYCPSNLELGVDKAVKIPTGIRCKMNSDWVLMGFPRSGHGFKYGIHLANTAGIIDEDYYYSDNEGHIFIKLVNDSIIGMAQPIEIKKGDAFCQGIFLPFGITEDDEVTKVRNGGFGSTDNK